MEILIPKRLFSLIASAMKTTTMSTNTTTDILQGVMGAWYHAQVVGPPR